MNDEDLETVEKAHDDLNARWPEVGGKPLHSYDIRFDTEAFTWLRADKEKRTRFLNDVMTVLTTLPVLGIACVIDRPGYMDRYSPIYDSTQRWKLCKTAFSVVVERAVKHVRNEGRRLRVHVEASDSVTDKMVRGYYDDLGNNGLPFNTETSAKYKPLTAADFASTFYGFKYKDKKSRAMQFADLYLWPMCKAGYKPDERSYLALKQANRLIDTHLDDADLEQLGIKYSCFPKAGT